jgi:DNA repair protein RecN (Recombination protein N)
MLKNLKIQQFVIIEDLDLDLKNGLTIMTGETGAGKSILLDAMGLILGDDSDPESIRSGSDESVFKALFAPPKNHPVWKLLIQSDLVNTEDTEFLVHRVMKRGGDDEIRINDKVVEQELMQKIGKVLVEIHGQFANQSLTDPKNQLTLLDLSGNFPPEVFENVATALDNVKRFKRELDEEKKFLARHKGRVLRKIEEVVKKFESVNMREGFIEEAQAEYERLLTAKETSEAFQSILGRLIAGNGVVVSLSAANNTLKNQENLEKEKMEDLARYLNDSLKNARDAVTEMNRLLPEYEIDTGPLEHYKKILTTLHSISKDNKVPFEDLTDYYIDFSTKLNRVRNGQEKLKELEKALADAKRDYLAHAKVLSDKRKEAGVALSKAIMAELPPLKLNKAEFEVVVEERPNDPWTKLGLDRVTFTARMNPGMPFSPISDTASGGELARMMLGLKVVVQEVQTTPTLVFDEVDTGIGGAAAAAVGERISMLADNTQVLVITHSPQVASRGHQHLYISKKTDDVTTTSSVRELTMEERTDEISRMLAGDTLTDESRAAAMRLIREAEEAAKIRKEANKNKPPPPPKKIETEEPEGFDPDAEPEIEEVPEETPTEAASS